MIEFKFSLELIFFCVLYLGLFTFIIHRAVAKWFFVTTVSCFYILFSFRSSLYNLDNYYYNIIFDSYEVSVWQSWLIKLEPLHYLLRKSASSFNTWLLYESFLFIILTIILMKRAGFIVTVLISSFSLPLYTSSFRFSLAAIIIAVAITFLKNRFMIAAIGSSSHLVSLFVPLKRYPFVLLVVVLSLIFFRAYLPSEILARMPSYSQLEFKLDGIKTLLHVIAILTIIKILNVNNYLYVRREVFIILILFSLTTLLSDLFNRALIISSILLVAESNLKSVERNKLARINAVLLLQFLWLVFVISPAGILLFGVDSNPDWEMYE